MTNSIFHCALISAERDGLGGDLRQPGDIPPGQKKAGHRRNQHVVHNGGIAPAPDDQDADDGVDDRAVDGDAGDVADAAHALNQRSERNAADGERDPEGQPAYDCGVGGAAQDTLGDQAAESPHDEGSGAGQDDGAPEDGAAGDGEGALVLLGVGLGNLTGADDVEAEGGHGGPGGEQGAEEADQADAHRTKQNGKNLGARQADEDVRDRSSADDGGAFQNAAVGCGLVGQVIPPSAVRISARR